MASGAYRLAPASGLEIGTRGQSINCRSVGGHHRATIPALLKPARHPLATRANPAPLRRGSQHVQKRKRLRFLACVLNPHLWQTLIRRKLANRTRQILALHTRVNAFSPEPIDPQRGHDQIGSLDQAWHEQSIAGSVFEEAEADNLPHENQSDNAFR